MRKKVIIRIMAAILISGVISACNAQSLDDTVSTGQVHVIQDDAYGALYHGNPIPIDFDPDRGKTSVTLKAYATSNGLWDSNVTTCDYELTNEIPVPVGMDSTCDGQPHIGVDRSSFYTLTAKEGSGVTIDAKGNAVATEEGTYTVKGTSVTSKGTIKAVSKGTCYVCAYAQNGVYKRIKVTVR